MFNTKGKKDNFSKKVTFTQLSSVVTDCSDSGTVGSDGGRLTGSAGTDGGRLTGSAGTDRKVAGSVLFFASSTGKLFKTLYTKYKCFKNTTHCFLFDKFELEKNSDKRLKLRRNFFSSKIQVL